MKSMERFVNFSDAVMAIAVTLLVLPLVDVASDARVTSFGEFKSTYGHLLFIFILSFVVICRYWQVHHQLLQSLKTFNVKLFWLNAAWLLSIVLMPFTSEMLGNSGGDNSFVIGTYIGLLLITSFIGVLMQLVALTSPELRKSSNVDIDSFYFSVANVLVLALALVLGVAFPAYGPAFLLLLIPGAYLSTALKPKLMRR